MSSVADDLNAIAPADFVRSWAKTRPDSTALVFGDRRTSYRDLDCRSNMVANGLLAMQLPAEDRIAILDRNSDVACEILIGANKANVPLVPLNTRLAFADIVRVMGDSEASILFASRDLLPEVDLLLAKLPKLDRVIVLEEDYAEWRDAQAVADPALPTSLDHTFVQIYTSGTTGEPKGVQISNGNLTSGLPDWIRSFDDWQCEDIVLQCLPIFHVGGLCFLLCCFAAGASNIILREFDAERALRLVDREKATIVTTVPTMLRMIVSAPDLKQADVSTLRLIIYGGAPMHSELLRAVMSAFPGAGFGQVYGLSETSAVLTYLSADDHRDPEKLAATATGRPVGPVEIKIADKAGRELPPGESGQVLCRAPQVTKGYWRKDEQTRQVIRNDWLHTGDIGFVDEAGYLHLRDRMNDLIISGGENIYPTEVESAILGHPIVAEVVVIGVPDPVWGESVKAVLVVKPDCEPDTRGILHYAREHLAPYKVPKSIDYVDALPRNAAGKTLRRAVRDTYAERPASADT